MLSSQTKDEVLRDSNYGLYLVVVLLLFHIRAPQERMGEFGRAKGIGKKRGKHHYVP
jgi:hypothetical protein